MKFGDAILEISSISNVSSQQADGITILVRSGPYEFQLYIISLDRPTYYQRVAYELLHSLCAQENYMMKRQLPQIAGAHFNPNYAKLYAQFGVPLLVCTDNVAKSTTDYAVKQLSCNAPIHRSENVTESDAERAHFSSAELITGVGGVYLLTGTREFIISFCSESMRGLVQCGKVIKGLEALEETATRDGKSDAVVANAFINQDCF